MEKSETPIITEKGQSFFEKLGLRQRQKALQHAQKFAGVVEKIEKKGGPERYLETTGKSARDLIIKMVPEAISVLYQCYKTHDSTRKDLHFLPTDKAHFITTVLSWPIRMGMRSEYANARLEPSQVISRNPDIELIGGELARHFKGSKDPFAMARFARAVYNEAPESLAAVWPNISNEVKFQFILRHHPLHNLSQENNSKLDEILNPPITIDQSLLLKHSEQTAEV